MYYCVILRMYGQHRADGELELERFQNYSTPEPETPQQDVLRSSRDKQGNVWSEIFRFHIELLANAEMCRNNSQPLCSFI
jgi:hypothetical protein